MKPPDNISAVEGLNVMLACGTRGFPIPHIRWRRDGEFLLQNGSRLEIIHVSKEDEGRYECVATNVAGSASAWATVTVQGTLSRAK